WYDKIRQQYHVRANLFVSGDVYRQQGTTFPTRLLVIDKSGPTTGKVVTGQVDLAGAIDLLEPIRHDRPVVQREAPQSTDSAPAEKGRSATDTPPARPGAGDLGGDTPPRQAPPVPPEQPKADD